MTAWDVRPTTAALYPGTAESPFATAETTETFQRYYEESGPDYEAWSPGFNMHFGYWRPGLNPLHREAMLEEMNAQILDRLHLADHPSPAVLDMGCGLGATLRSLSRHLAPAAALTGVTLVPWQREQGASLNQEGPEATQATRGIDLRLGDYQNTGLPASSFDAAYAIESSCYARGAGKQALLAEAHRLLRPGGRLVIADAFLPHARALSGLQKAICDRLRAFWVIEALGELDVFTLELQSLGFRDVRIEPVQLHVAPSVAHVPWVTCNFLFREVLFGQRKMTRARWNNVFAPLLLPWVSQPLGPLGYYIITATR